MCIRDRHGTGAVISSGAIDDIEAVGALTAVNAYAGLATGDSIQSIEAEQQGLIDSHIQKQAEQQQFKTDLNSQVNQIKQQQQSLAEENQRLKLELENARMKAELARLQGQQSAALSTQNGSWNSSPQLGDTSGSGVSDVTQSASAGNITSPSSISEPRSDGIELGPSKEQVTSTFAVCTQSKTLKIKPGVQWWGCDGPLQNTTRENTCLLYTSPNPRDRTRSRMPSSA